MQAAKWIARKIGTGLAVVLGFFLLCLVAFAAFKVIDWQEKLEGRPGLISNPESEDEATRKGLKLIGLYCLYGSVSRAQLEGCDYHVKPADILKLETNASLYVQGKLDTCEADAGPFCGDHYRRIVEEKVENADLDALTEP